MGSFHCLKKVPVTELCGIAESIGRFLVKYGVYTCGDMEKLPIGVLAKHFGNIGRRIWYMCQGADPDPMHIEVKAPKSMGHGKVMPPNTRHKSSLLLYLRHRVEKLAARLRQHIYKPKYFSSAGKAIKRAGLALRVPYPALHTMARLSTH